MAYRVKRRRSGPGRLHTVDRMRVFIMSLPRANYASSFNTTG